MRLVSRRNRETSTDRATVLTVHFVERESRVVCLLDDVKGVL